MVYSTNSAAGLLVWSVFVLCASCRAEVRPSAAASHPPTGDALPPTHAVPYLATHAARIPVQEAMDRAVAMEDPDEAAELLCVERVGRPVAEREKLRAALRQLYREREDTAPDVRLRDYQAFERHCTLRNWVVAEVTAAAASRGKQQPRIHTLEVADSLGFGCECPQFYLARSGSEVVFSEEFIVLHMDDGVRPMDPMWLAGRYRIRGHYLGDEESIPVTVGDFEYTPTFLVSSWCHLGPRSPDDREFYLEQLVRLREEGLLKVGDRCP